MGQIKILGDLKGSSNTFTQTLNEGNNTVTHNLNTTVTNVIVYDGVEQIPVSNWTIISPYAVNIPMTYQIVNAKIYIQVV